MFDEVISLMTENETTDEYGDATIEYVERQIFAQVKSITQTEFYQANAVGLRPEIKFVIADFADYENEQLVKYTPFGGEEQLYQVVRTYRDDLKLELVCKRGVD